MSLLQDLNAIVRDIRCVTGATFLETQDGCPGAYKHCGECENCEIAARLIRLSNTADDRVSAERFVDLYQKFVREGWDPKVSFTDTNLPEWDPKRYGMRQVIILRNQLVEFRAHYAMLMGMCALLLNKDPKDVCPLDAVLVADRLLHPKEGQ